MKFKQSGSTIVPFLMVVFLNTFVDIGHKALMMDTVYATTSAHTFMILSSTVNALMLLPYIFLVSSSGFIADRWPKVLVMQVTAFAAIPITLFLTLCYFMGWFWLAFCMTLLMAVQSALNSPAKYGYIKETFGQSQIARTNGGVQAIVIFSIVVSQAVFTFSANGLIAYRMIEVATKDVFITGFAPLGFILVALSIYEYFMTLRLRRSPASDDVTRYTVNRDIRLEYIRSYFSAACRKKTIIVCILGLSLFFAINQELLAIYGGYLKEQLAASANFALSSVGVAGIGILLGAGYTAKISRGFIETSVIPVSAFALGIGLLLLSHLQSELWVVVVMLCYGFFAGMLIVPLNALIQCLAESSSLGKVLAANNCSQTIAMLVYLLFGICLTTLGVSIVIQLHILLLFAVVGALASIVYFPQSLLRYWVYLQCRRLFRFCVLGLDDLPSQGAVLLFAYCDSDIDWAYLQLSSPRPIRFVTNQCFVEGSYAYKYFKRANRQPIPVDESMFDRVRQSLQAREIVCCLVNRASPVIQRVSDQFDTLIARLDFDDVVVLPCCVDAGNAFASSNKMTVHYGQPLTGIHSLKDVPATMAKMS